ncbi:MAG: ABC transporter ATP-binding protein, partial [Planctomycetota bacterium]
DEPTTALDVTIQAQILDILRRLRYQRGMSILFITHDLGVIAEIADDVLVMYRGKMVEQGSVLDIFTGAKHPYTKGLLACRPRLDTPYKLLPTVSDFMDATTDADGEPVITEKTLDAARLKQLTEHGRGRLLHPRSELAAMGHPWEEGAHQPDATTVEEGTPPLLEVQDLKVHFPVRRGLLSRTVGYVRAVDGVSFKVYRGQTLGLVGESGCGKTTTGRAILRLVEPTGGSVVYDGVDLRSLGRGGLRAMRRKLQIIFQDPYGSLNPRMTIESTLTEPMAIHRLGSGRRDRRDRAAALLEEVDLPASHLRRYPHEFSGGQRQRICIARALAVEPDFLICDESVSALDVSVQAQVLNLLKALQEKRGLTYIFISHDLSVVKFMADMMAVMQPVPVDGGAGPAGDDGGTGEVGGRIVEFGPSESIYADPRQAYTRRLIDATPKDDLNAIRRRVERRAERAGGSG